MSEEYQRLHDAATGNIIKGIRVSRSSAINVRTNTYSVPRHALATLSEKLIQQGRSLLFTTCSLLVQKLLIANRDLRLPKMIRQMSNVEALIIDDLGYVQQSREEMEVLFTLLAERDESGSVLLTSNLAFSNLDQIFKDAMTTAAAIDRLLHQSVIIEPNVPSFRVESAKKTKAKPPSVTKRPFPTVNSNCR